MTNDNGSLKSTTVTGVVWSLVEKFSVQGIAFLIELIIARIVGPESYGLIAMLAIFMSISQVFIDGGFSSALIQRQDRTETDFSTVFYINLGISLLAYGLLFVIAPYIAAFYGHPILADITRVYSLNLVINSLVAVNKTKLTIAVDFKTQSKISFWSALLSGLLGVALALLGYGVWALVFQALAMAVLNVLFSFYWVRWRPLWVFSTASFKRLFGFGSKLLVATLISSAYANLYSMFIGKKFPDATKLGFFSRADKFAQFIGTNLSGVITRVSFPVLSRIQDDDARLMTVYRKYMQASALFIFPLVLGMCGVSRPMIGTLLGDQWLPAAPLLQILCWAYVWDCMVQCNLNLIYVKGRSDFVLRLEVVKKSIGFAILFVTLFFDLTVICWGRVVYSIISLYLNTYYTKRLLGYGFLMQLREVSPYLLLSAMVAALGLLVSALVPVPWMALSIGVILGAVVYVSACHLLHLEAFEAVLATLRNRLTKGGEHD